MDARYPRRLRSLVSLIRAERAVEDATATALAQWTTAYLDLLIDGKAPNVRTPRALVAATTPDPSKSEQARPLWDALVLSLVLPKLRDLWRTQASKTYAGFNGAMSNVFEQRIRDWIDRAPDRFMTRANAIVADGVQLGLSADEIADDLRRELPDLIGPVSRNTGRMLGGDIWNDATIAGAMEAEKNGDFRNVKSWVSCRDLRVRLTHAEADLDPANDRIPLSAKFRVGGALADHPRDPALPLEEVMGCRCFVDIERA